MSKTDAIAQLKSLRQEAQAKAHPRSRLTIQERIGKDNADADVAALTMAIKALNAPRQSIPVWACGMWCMIFSFIGMALTILLGR